MARQQDLTLNAFKDSIQNIARGNRFIVEITTPWIGVRDYPLYANGKGSFKHMAIKASIPEFNVEGPTFNYRGQKMVLTGDYKREPLVITFINDSKWQARSFFEDWIRSYVNNDDSNERRRIDSYRLDTKISITQFGGTFYDVVAKYEYEDCAPMRVESIELDHSITNSIEEFKVEFHYSKWNRTKTDAPVLYDNTEGGLTVYDSPHEEKTFSTHTGGNVRRGTVLRRGAK